MLITSFKVLSNLLRRATNKASFFSTKAGALAMPTGAPPNSNDVLVTDWFRGAMFIDWLRAAMLTDWFAVALFTGWLTAADWLIIAAYSSGKFCLISFSVNSLMMARVGVRTASQLRG